MSAIATSTSPNVATEPGIARYPKRWLVLAIVLVAEVMDLIDRVSEIKDHWFRHGDTVLITAGASAPEEVVEECVAYLKEHFDAAVESRTVREEHVSFPLPRELRVLAG